MTRAFLASTVSVMIRCLALTTIRRTITVACDWTRGRTWRWGWGRGEGGGGGGGGGGGVEGGEEVEKVSVGFHELLSSVVTYTS